MKKLTSIYIVAFLLTMGCSVNAKDSNSKNSKINTTTQAYQWYDGSKQKTVYLDETMIADFNPQSVATTKAAHNSNLSAAKTINGTRLWKLTSGSSKSALNSIKSKNQAGSYSPVFRTSQGGQMRALPGSIIVQFASDWDESKIRQWTVENGQTISSKASFGTNFYILTSPAGLASLEIANRLYETGDVLLATPNWWVERHVR